VIVAFEFYGRHYHTAFNVQEKSAIVTPTNVGRVVEADILATGIASSTIQQEF
jgi:hypothetical protein